MPDRTELATVCGVVGPVVSLGAIVLATVLAPPETFTWGERALSDMGRYGAPTFALFNGGLIAGGLLGSPFVWRLWIASRNALERVGIVLLAVAVVGMIGVGIFFIGHENVYLGRSLHGFAAVTVFGVAPFASWVYATGAALAEDGTLAIASFWLGIVHPLAWLGWSASVDGAGDAGAWFAVPEFVAAVAFAGWILLLALVVRRRDRTDSPGPSASDV